MRMLLNVKMPHQQFNAAVRDGTAGSKLDAILEATKPEAVYFTEQNGLRTAILIVDLPDPSKAPALAEPWFLGFEADVEFHIVMTPDDLKKAGVGNTVKNGVDQSEPRVGASHALGRVLFYRGKGQPIGLPRLILRAT